MWLLINVALKIAAAGLCGLVKYYRHARQSASWPCVPGELLNYDLLENANANPAVYSLQVKYCYSFNGELFEASDLMFYFPEWSSSRSYYARLQDTLTAQSPLSVFVNPDNPRESVLLSGVAHVPVWLLPTAVVMMLVCPVCFITAIYVLFLA